MSAISISSEDVQLICREGEMNYPEECCGFLFGRTDETTHDIIEVQPIVNEQTVNRARRFLISPEEFRRAESYAYKNELELVGFYHTHPDHPAVPSDYDREHALPYYSYIILSIRGGQAEELRSWQLDLNREGYSEEQINVKAEAVK